MMHLCFGIIMHTVHDHPKLYFFYLLVVRCQSDSDVAQETADEVSDLGIVGDDVQDFGDGSFSSAPGIDTVCVFPKNSAKSKNLLVLDTKISVLFYFFNVLIFFVHLMQW